MRILVSGVNYAPEVTGIAPYTTGIAEYLAEQGHEVIVATTFPFAPLWQWFEPPPRWRTRERLNGVGVWRTKIVLPPRRTVAWRIAFDSSIGLTSALTALSIPRVDLTICVSPPIQSALSAAAIRFRLGKLVIFVQDLPSEAARSVGMMNDGLALRIGRSLEHLAYKLADHVVVISRAFASYIEGIGVPPERITEISNWADIESIRPAPRDHAMRDRLGAGRGDFLVLYTGNMGAKQDLLNVVHAAELLKDNKKIRFALIGDGQERERIAQHIAARQLDNIRLLPLQPSREFATVLAAADVLLINQAPMIIDSVMPSKLLAYMASGRPVLAAAHANSSVAELITLARCGLVADPGRPEALAGVITFGASQNVQSGTLSAMGQHGRAYVEQHFERTSILRRWETLVTDLAAARSAMPS